MSMAKKLGRVAIYNIRGLKVSQKITSAISLLVLRLAPQHLARW